MKLLTERRIGTALVLYASLALVGSASAELKTWVGGYFGNPSDEWMLGTTDQWSNDVLAQLTPPGLADYAIILDAEYSGLNLLPYPHIRTDVGTVDYLGVSLHSDRVAELEIEVGGSLSVVNVTTVGGDEAGTGNSIGIIDVTGGSMTTNELRIGSPHLGAITGQGQVNVDAGAVQSSTVTFGINGNLDVELGAFFYLDGDQTGSVSGWVTNGFITAEDGAGTVDYHYDGANVRTVITAASSEVLGDYNASGQVEQGDLDLVLLNWGATWPPEILGWVNQQPTDDGLVDQNDLDGVLLNWGNSATTAGSVVPEPMSLASLIIGVLGCLLAARRTR